MCPSDTLTSIISICFSINGIMPTKSRFRSINLRTDALDALMDRLNRLKDHNGQMQGDSLWLDDNESRLCVPKVSSVEQINHLQPGFPTKFNAKASHNYQRLYSRCHQHGSRIDAANEINPRGLKNDHCFPRRRCFNRPGQHLLRSTLPRHEFYPDRNPLSYPRLRM